MKRFAVFVEGQTELIIIREFLLRYFEYSNINIECRTLFKKGKFHKADYDSLNPDAEFSFQIINVGNDTAVLSVMLKREDYLWKVGFDHIICIRDMYSSDYKHFSSSIEERFTLKFQQQTRITIDEKAIQPENISFCYAIMETESWFLGISEIFVEIDPLLTNDYINSELGINLAELDPEKEIFHPAQMIKEIYSLSGKNYNKSKGSIEAIAKVCTKQRYEDLNNSEKCSSFSQFYSVVESILN